MVYQYDGATLSTVISKSYTDMIVADFTGKGDTQDLVLALPPDSELGGVTLQLLTANDGEFRSTQTLNLGEGVYSSCAALHAGTGSDDGMYLVMDAWTGASGLVSDIILYDAETGFLQPYRPSGLSDIQRSTLRYHSELLSCDIDNNGTVDIPVEIDDGGTLQTPMDKRLSFVLWKDYTSAAGGNSRFGVYDSEYNFFMQLPESMHGSVLIRSNQSGTGWLLCQRRGHDGLLRNAGRGPGRQRGHRRGELPAHCQHRQPAAAGAGGHTLLRIEFGHHQPEHRAVGFQLK